ncbi:MAG: AEC family transporter [Alkalispirochaeta sp.]
MVSSLVDTLLTLILLAGAGFVAFRHPWMQKNLFPTFLVLVLDILFPLYFVFRIPRGWEDALVLGWPFMMGMFLLSLVSMAVQGWLAGRVVRWKPEWISNPTTFVLLAALHNAGFVPLPIIERLTPGPIVIGMSFYFLAFNLVIWTVAVSVIRTGRFSIRHFRIKPTAALGGLVIGLALSMTGVYRHIPEQVMTIGGHLGNLGLDLALVALGGALAGISEKLSFDREHWFFVGWRMILFPLAVVGLTALPLPVFSGPLGWPIRLVLILEAAVPPATLVLVVTRAYGRPEQLHYTGSMMLFSYLVSLVTIPLFITLAVVLYG